MLLSEGSLITGRSLSKQVRVDPFRQRFYAINVSGSSDIQRINLSLKLVDLCLSEGYSLSKISRHE